MVVAYFLYTYKLDFSFLFYLLGKPRKNLILVYVAYGFLCTTTLFQLYYVMCIFALFCYEKGRYAKIIINILSMFDIKGDIN